MKNVEPFYMLPRFDSEAIFNEIHLEEISKSNSIYRKNSLSFENPIFHDTGNESRFDSNFLICQSLSHPQLPRFHSNHRRIYYDENQSADTAVETKYRPKKVDIKFLERAYDRSGKKCWPAINTNIGKCDLEYAYEIVGDTLESYIRYRKLNRCQALSNFIQYRNNVYKREKIAQYASSETKSHMKEMRTEKTTSIPTKMIKLEEKQSPRIPASPSTIPEIVPSTFISSSPSEISETSQKLPPPITTEAFIPIPSPGLLKPSTPKSAQRITTPKPSNLNVPTKTNVNMKQTSSPSIKGQS